MENENLFAEKQIRTFTGKYVNVFDPNPDTIVIEDIAHALSMLPRWGGHCPYFFSVAQHSVNVSQSIDDRYKCKGHQLAGLLHDASEAYLIDLPRPIKQHMPHYKQIEDKLMKVISAKFGFEYPFHFTVKDSDELHLHEEWEHLIIKRDYKDIRDYCLTPERAKSFFMMHFKSYTE